MGEDMDVDVVDIDGLGEFTLLELAESEDVVGEVVNCVDPVEVADVEE
jgi:hypothetical protein